jgi:putative transposase
VKGRKRPLLVDTLGLLLFVLVHSADIQEKDGAKLLLEQVVGKFPRLELIWADGGYAGWLVEWVKSVAGWVLEIVKRPEQTKGFVLLKKRSGALWAMERTFAWLGNYHRLDKDHELLPESSENLIRLAMIHLMLRRLAPA